jgi:hypothetical protein
MTPEVIDSLKELLLMAHAAAVEIEHELPEDVHAKKWMAAKHSPTPWATTYSHYINQEGADGSLMALAVRSQIADVIEKLDWCVKQAEAEKRPVNLKLAKVRRSV